MTRTSASFAALAHHSLVEVAGYSWMTVRRDDGSIQLSPSGEPRLPDVSIVERPSVDGRAPTFLASVQATGLGELAAIRDGFDSAEAAITWATAFEFASRPCGSLTWYALAPDAPTGTR